MVATATDPLVSLVTGKANANAMKTLMVLSVISVKKDSTTSQLVRVVIVTLLVSLKPSKAVAPCQLVSCVSVKNESKEEFATSANPYSGIYNPAIQTVAKVSY